MASAHCGQAALVYLPKRGRNGENNPSVAKYILPETLQVERKSFSLAGGMEVLKVNKVSPSLDVLYVICMAWSLTESNLIYSYCTLL